MNVPMKYPDDPKKQAEYAKAYLEARSEFEEMSDSKLYPTIMALKLECIRRGITDKN